MAGRSNRFHPGSITSGGVAAGQIVSDVRRKLYENPSFT